MKFRATMKDSDALHEAIGEAALATDLPLDEDEREAVLSVREKKLADACRRWFEYGECLTVEVDTDAGTCVVVPVKGRNPA